MIHAISYNYYNSTYLNEPNGFTGGVPALAAVPVLPVFGAHGLGNGALLGVGEGGSLD